MSANDKLAATFGPGRTTPTPTLETRIAEVLDDAIGFDCTHQDFDNPLHADAPGKCHHCYQQALKLAAALAPVIASLNAKAWHDGRESVALDMLGPLNEHGQRAPTTNPYRSNDDHQ